MTVPKFVPSHYWGAEWGQPETPCTYLGFQRWTRRDEYGMNHDGPCKLQRSFKTYNSPVQLSATVRHAGRITTSSETLTALIVELRPLMI